MKKFLGLAIFCIFIGGCSQATTENVSTRNSDTGSKNTNVSSSMTQAQNTNAANTTMEEFMNANNVPPAANSAVNSANSPAIKSSDSLMDAMQKRGRGKRANAVPIDPHARQILTVAPDNSEISTEMNKQGQPIETRTFRDNSSLDKVVRTYVTTENPQVKVFLKNGKVLDLPKSKIDNIFNASADEILNAVGAAPQKSAPASKK